MNTQASYYIEAYLKQYSEKTIKEYSSDIRDFYRFLHGVDYSDLETSQLYLKNDGSKLTKIDIINYKEKVINEPSNKKKKKNSEGTLKRKLYTMRSFFRFLQGEGFSVNLDIFDAKNIRYIPDSYDPLSKQQALELADFIKKERKNDGQEFFSYIVIAITTSIRVNALSNIEFSDVTYEEDEEVYYITTRNVREKLNQIVSMPIKPWMYEMILLNKKEGSNKVFPSLNSDLIHEVITTYSAKMGLTGRFTSHSLRKTAAVHEMKTRGNIQMGMKQLGHKNAQTFIGSYSKYAVSSKEMTGMRMFTEVDDSIFDNVSKEQILQALKMFNMTAYEQVAFAVIDKKV